MIEVNRRHFVLIRFESQKDRVNYQEAVQPAMDEALESVEGFVAYYYMIDSKDASGATLLLELDYTDDAALAEYIKHDAHKSMLNALHAVPHKLSIFDRN